MVCEEGQLNLSFAAYLSRCKQLNDCWLFQVQGSDVISALSVIGEKSGLVCQAEVYGRMKELQYLFLDGCPVNGDFSSWSEELKWLQWKYFPHGQLPLSLDLPSLAVLDLSNSKCLTQVWVRDLEQEVRLLYFLKYEGEMVALLYGRGAKTHCPNNI